MNPYIILTDVTCDLSPEIREAFGMTDYVHGYVSISDGRDLKTQLDWSLISREDFYNCLGNRQMKVSTAPASPEEYYQIFKKYAEEAKVAMRNIRRDGMDYVKKLKKNSEITEDDQKKAEKDLQDLLDKYTKKADEALAAKEKELMAI